MSEPNNPFTAANGIQALMTFYKIYALAPNSQPSTIDSVKNQVLSDLKKENIYNFISNKFQLLEEWIGMHLDLNCILPDETVVTNAPVMSCSLLENHLQTNPDLVKQWTDVLIHSFYRNGFDAHQQATLHLFQNKLIQMIHNEGLCPFIGTIYDEEKKKTTVCCSASIIRYCIDGCAFIFVVCTKESYRKKGLASQLLRFLCKTLQSEGVELIDLKTGQATRKISHVCLQAEPMGVNVYKRLGFTEDYRLENYCP